MAAQPRAEHKFGAAERGLLPEGRLQGPMPWVLAIMMFLTVLAAAAGLGLGNAARNLDSQVGNRLVVQIVEANPDRRERQARRAVAELERLAGVEAVRRVSAEEMARLMEPLLGKGALETDVPVPAMIDVDVDGTASADAIRTAVVRAAPSARVDDSAQWLDPVAKLIASLRWLAAALVALMVGATTATVVLAARASLDTHRGTIEVLHLMGATDVQVARLFQRRIALDAAFGGTIGLVAAALVLLLIGNRVGALGSELIGSAGLPVASWLVLVALPLGGILLAILVARTTILRALSKLL
jgi:cell division transport system permease protein